MVDRAEAAQAAAEENQCRVAEDAAKMEAELKAESTVLLVIDDHALSRLEKDLSQALQRVAKEKVLIWLLFCSIIVLIIILCF